MILAEGGGRCKEVQYPPKRGPAPSRFVIYDEGMRDRAMDRLRLREIVEDAIRADRLEVHYQPIVNTGDATWLGFEALVRCRTATGELLPPATFLGVAEAAGLLQTIDRIVLAKALAQLARWHELPGAAKLTMSVNASARALLAPDYEDVLTDLLQQFDVPAECLTIELTEDVHVSDPKRVGSVLSRLRARGVSIALDDFGTGYSCLAYLRDLPIDVIKVPIHFTAMLSGSTEARALAELVLSIGQTIGVSTVAEGVETAQEWSMLRALNCDRAQGYYFSRPRTAVAIAQCMREGDHLPQLLPHPPASSLAPQARQRLLRARQRQPASNPAPTRIDEIRRRSQHQVPSTPGP
jgi:EAL domain-containing protein (putative c-di-GMP-specific phosphodiesterase class I)